MAAQSRTLGLSSDREEAPETVISLSNFGISKWYLLPRTHIYSFICPFIEQTFIEHLLWARAFLFPKGIIVNKKETLSSWSLHSAWELYAVVVYSCSWTSNRHLRLDRSKLTLGSPSPSNPFSLSLSYLSEWRCHSFCCLGKKLWSYPWFLSFYQLHTIYPSSSPLWFHLPNIFQIWMLFNHPDPNQSSHSLWAA